MINNLSNNTQNDDLSSAKIMKLIDVNSINIVDKKRRGRPKKSSANESLNNIDNNLISENEEIILHLNLTKQDIETYKKNVNINDIPELNEAIDSNCNENDESCNNNLNNSFINNGTCNNIASILNNNSSFINNNNNNFTNNGTSNNNNFTNNGTSNNQQSYSENINDSIIDVSSKTANSLIRKLNAKIEELTQFIKINMPMYFTKVNSYPSDLQLFDTNGDKCIPKLTNICCWHDTEPFDTYPVFIPQKFYGNKFYVFGCFCSFNCACAYNLSLKDGDVLSRHSNLIRLFYEVNKNKLENIKDVEINPSGKKEKLKKFGGSMTITEFRENSKMLGRTSNEFLPNCHQIKISYDEIITSKNINKSLENITI